MVRPAHGIDGRHSEAVGGEWKQVVHLEHGGICLCLEDGALVPGAIFSDPDVNEVVRHVGVVRVERGRPREVDGAGGEGHDERSPGRVGNSCNEVSALF